MAKLKAVIPPQRFELVRNRIGEIAADEFTNQFELSEGTTPNITKVHIERCIPFDKTDLPTINVSLARGDYNNKSTKSVDGNYVYNIDCYASAKSSEGTEADKAAVLLVHRMVGMVRAIFENPSYRTLLYAAPFTCSVSIGSITIADPTSNGDSISEAQARVELLVRVPETVELITPEMCAGISTVVKLYSTSKGYHYGPEGGPTEVEAPFVPEDDPNGYFVPEDEEVHTPLKFSEVATAPGIEAIDFFVGLQKTGETTYANYNFTGAQLIEYVLSNTRKIITADADGSDLADVWMDGKDIQELVTEGQAYLKDVHFTQTGGIITGTSIKFYIGQKVIVKL